MISDITRPSIVCVDSYYAVVWILLNVKENGTIKENGKLVNKEIQRKVETHSQLDNGDKVVQTTHEIILENEFIQSQRVIPKDYADYL